jgi:hypothetical protein
VAGHRAELGFRAPTGLKVGSQRRSGDRAYGGTQLDWAASSFCSSAQTHAPDLSGKPQRDHRQGAGFKGFDEAKGVAQWRSLKGERSGRTS